MGKFFNKVFRFNRHRQEAIEQQRRINNLVANSNCIGTTARLFNSNWTRAAARNLIAHKKNDCNRTIKQYKKY